MYTGCMHLASLRFIYTAAVDLVQYRRHSNKQLNWKLTETK